MIGLMYKFDNADGWLVPYVYYPKDKLVARALSQIYWNDKNRHNYKDVLYHLVYALCSTDDLEYLTDMFDCEKVSELVDKVINNVDKAAAKNFNKAHLEDYVLELFKYHEIEYFAEKVKEEVTDLLYDEAYDAFEEEMNEANGKQS